MNQGIQKRDKAIHYSGKVRDIYIEDHQIFIVVSDRISAFDVVLPRMIPYKGAVLNGISTYFLDNTRTIVPNWLISSPNSHCCYGHYAPTIPIEVIVRGYLAGSMWRAYEKGERVFCGNRLPDGLRNNQRLDHPIITPTTKAAAGHDEDTSTEEILQAGILSATDWNLIQEYAFKLFDFGSNHAAKQDLILVDTKFEFGRKSDGTIILIDEILTPDSSRYYIAENYQERFEKGENPIQLSKEFVRQWLISENFMGRDGDHIPEMSDEWVLAISEKYIELYAKLLGKTFVKESQGFDLQTIQNIYDSL